MTGSEGDPLAAVQAHKGGYLSESLDMVHPAAVRASGLDGLHLKYGALHGFDRHNGAAFIADKPALLANDFSKAAAAIRSEKLVGDDWERHGSILSRGNWLRVR